MDLKLCAASNGKKRSVSDFCRPPMPPLFSNPKHQLQNVGNLLSIKYIGTSWSCMLFKWHPQWPLSFLWRSHLCTITHSFLYQFKSKEIATPMVQLEAHWRAICKIVTWDCVRFCFIPQLVKYWYLFRTLINHLKNELDDTKGWDTVYSSAESSGVGKIFHWHPWLLSQIRYFIHITVEGNLSLKCCVI